MGQVTFTPARQAAEFRGRQIVLRLMRPFAREASTQAAIARLTTFSDGLSVENSPIFVLSAGWRTGSTLLQRMINAVPGTLIWGEPYSEAGIVQRLAESVRFLDPESGRFHGRVLAPGADLPSEDEFTATLTPSLDNLVHAYRALIDRLLCQPAAARGCERWGVKEVVWDGDCIQLLQLLFPSAKFILLVREPQAQWRSYRPETRRPWFYRWPQAPIGGPRAFGAMWRDLVGDFVDADARSPHVTVVRYEDVRSAEELERLTTFLGLDHPLRSDLARVGSSGQHRFYTPRVPAWERAVIRAMTETGRRHFGYE